MKVVIMAGGTGGHIFPGLAVANELIKKNVEVLWLGAIGGMEENIIKDNNIPIHLLNIKGLRGKGIKGFLGMPYKLIKATLNAGKYLKSEKVSAVISMGGYVAAPGGIAARLKKIPLLVHEQNSIFGMTNKYLSKFAQTVLTGFNLDEIYKSQWIGNPVRADIENVIRTKKTDDSINILILGGSLGAQAINEKIPPLLNVMAKDNNISIKHQTGKNKIEKTTKLYGSHNSVETTEFIKDMSSAYAWADVVIARAGALTVAEINAVGIPAIYIPYPHAVDDHQTYNAKSVVENNGAYIWQESEDVNLLKEKIENLITNSELRKNLASNAKNLHKKNAALVLANKCMEMLT